MKTVITYGTFDLLHTGHLNLLKRAKALGDRLIVGVTSEAYDHSRGKLNVMQSLDDRIDNVKKTGLADLIIVEEQEGQKLLDILKYEAEIFAIGSDWCGEFDYLNDYCQVVYLERTRGVSSTELRLEKNLIVRMGVVGNGRIANRFVQEAKYVSGIDITSVYGRDENKAREFAEHYELSAYYADYDAMLENVDAVYVAVPHHVHYDFAKKALLKGKHVLCEKPLSPSLNEAQELFELAERNQCILLEAVKTAFAPAFRQLIGVAKSGVIGNIRSVNATFTKLIEDKSSREYDLEQAGGALTELGTYPLLAVAKLFGVEQMPEVRFVSSLAPGGIDVYTHIDFIYPHGVATTDVGIGVKKEGDLCIAGTKGYIYVPAPWWKTELFEVRYENVSENRKYFLKFEGDGLRYELAFFLHMIHGDRKPEYEQAKKVSLFMAEMIQRYRGRKGVRYIFDK